MTTFESTANKLTSDALIIDGWFKAPETGEYRFHLSGDDVSELYLNKTPFDADSASQRRLQTDAGTIGYPAPSLGKEHLIADRNSASEWRQYYNEVPKTQNDQSDWINLEKDKFYQTQAFMIERNGGDHLTVAMEFKKEDTAGHP